MEFVDVWERWLQCFRDAGMSWIDDMLSRARNESDQPYWEWATDDGFPTEPFEIVKLTGEGRALFIDRSGPTVGRVWSWDANPETEGSSLAEFVSGLISKVEAGIYVPSHDQRYWK